MPARFRLPPLPFSPDALSPAISAETFAEHHGGHHQAYVDSLNRLAGDEGMEGADLLEIIRETADADPEDVSELVSSGDLFVHAAQHFNHAFFWQSLSPDGGAPNGDLQKAINRAFGSLGALKDAMIETGAGHFASGWLWLVSDEDGLQLMDTHDAQTPVIDPELKPLLVIDLWEHAYYLDHKRARKAYLEALITKHLNWDFAARALAADNLDDLGLGIANG